MGSKDKIHGTGVIMVVFGMAGFAEISTSSHGSFLVCALMVGIGFALCLAGYVK